MGKLKWVYWNGQVQQTAQWPWNGYTEMGKLKWVTTNVSFSCQDPPKFSKSVIFPSAFLQLSVIFSCYPFSLTLYGATDSSIQQTAGCAKLYEILQSCTSQGIGRQGICSFCKNILCFNTMPCRHMPLFVHFWTTERLAEHCWNRLVWHLEFDETVPPRCSTHIPVNWSPWWFC